MAYRYEPKGNWGGKREGAGRPKGSPNNGVRSDKGGTHVMTKERSDKGGSHIMIVTDRKTRSDKGKKRGAYRAHKQSNKPDELRSQTLTVTLNKTEWAILASIAPDGKGTKEAVRCIRAYLSTLTANSNATTTTPDTEAIAS